MPLSNAGLRGDPYRIVCYTMQVNKEEIGTADAKQVKLSELDSELNQLNEGEALQVIFTRVDR